MKSSVEKLSATRVKLTVEVPFEELKPEIDSAYKTIANQVNIPGFRRGKAPRKLIDARFGRGPILEQVVNDMLPSRYESAVKEHELKVLSQPKIDITKIEDNELVEFVAEVDVRPEIDVPDFSEISVTVPALTVSDDEVEESLTQLRRRFAELKPIERELQEGDFATLDVTTTRDGEADEDRSAEALSYKLGEKAFVPELDANLVGKKAGDEFDYSVSEDDQQLEIHVKVSAAKENVLPELDEEFVQMASEFDTVDELREDTRKNLLEMGKNKQATAIRDEVLKAALEKTEFEIPEAVVEEQVHNSVHQLLGQMAHDEEILGRVLEAQGITREEFDGRMRSEAETAVRTQLFLDAVADEVTPQISQEEINEHIMYTAANYGMSPDEFLQQVMQANQLGNLFADLRRGKALAESIVKVSVTDEEGQSVDPAEYFGEDESEDSEDEKQED